MATDSTNILEGVCRLFIGAAANSTTPDTLPADTIAFGGLWGGTWRDVGYTTEAGVSISLAQRFTDVRTAQDRNVTMHLRNGSDDKIMCALLEATLLNLRDATGRGAITTVAPVAAAPNATPPTPMVPGHSDLALTDDALIRYVAIGFEGVAPPNTKGNPRRVLFPLALSIAAVVIAQRLGAPTSIPVEFSRVGSYNPVIRDILTTP